MTGPLPLRHPASLLATWFGSGLLPGAPGTWGSLAALPVAAAIAALAGPWGLLGAAIALFPVGLWASARYSAHGPTGDPPAVVIDEVVGQWLALVPLATDWRYYAVAFLAFRFFDIVKVWPASHVERRWPGAWGIMGDDVVAGIYAAALTATLAKMVGAL